jgi:hypothetical protein
MTVTAHEFLHRFLLHVLPKGLVRIRSFGFLANRRRGAQLAQCQRLLTAQPESRSRPSQAQPMASARLSPIVREDLYTDCLCEGLRTESVRGLHRPTISRIPASGPVQG